MYPKIRFQLDPKKDIRTFYCFISDARYDNGKILDWAIFQKYPFFKKYKKNNSIKIGKDQVKKFVLDIYKKKDRIMEKGLVLYPENWKKVEQKFYLLTDKLFKNKYWPKGKYIAYLTIWGMYPRFLEDKTFQIPYIHKDKDYVNAVIAHEMLHFKFYDYFFKNYPKYNKRKNDFLIWDASEIFNVIIQNTPSWIKKFKAATKAYPEHKKITKKLQKEYNKKGFFSAKELIEDILKELESGKNNND